MSISIPDVFRAINTMNLYGDVFRPRMFYGGLIGQGYGRASSCIGCGQCEGVCPQHLPIIELLKEASAKLDDWQRFTERNSYAVETPVIP